MNDFLNYIGSGHNATPFEKLKAYIDNAVKKVFGSIGSVRSGPAAPTTSDIPQGKYAVWYNTTSSTTALYYNSNGTIQQL